MLQADSPSVCVGDLVYLHSEQGKPRVRDRYFVVSVNGSWFSLRRFVAPS